MRAQSNDNAGTWKLVREGEAEDGNELRENWREKNGKRWEKGDRKGET